MPPLSGVVPTRISKRPSLRHAAILRDTEYDSEGRSGFRRLIRLRFVHAERLRTSSRVSNGERSQHCGRANSDCIAARDAERSPSRIIRVHAVSI
jgi:hypothetical protein